MVIDQGSGGPLSDSGKLISATANDAMMVRAAAHQGGHGHGGQGVAPRGSALGQSVRGSTVVGAAGGAAARGEEVWGSAAGVHGGAGVADEGAAAGGAGGRQGDVGASAAGGAGQLVAAGGGAGGVSSSLIDDDLLVETGPLGDRDTAPLDDLIWHPSDTAVKPIVANRRIGRVRMGWGRVTAEKQRRGTLEECPACGRRRGMQRDVQEQAGRCNKAAKRAAGCWLHRVQALERSALQR